MTGEPVNSEIILYQTEDGRTRIQCRFENETLWLTQKLIAELFQIGVNTVNHHLKEIISEGELQAEATIRRYRIVQTEGTRQITREIEYERYRSLIDSQPRQVDQDFEQTLKQLERVNTKMKHTI